MSQSSIRSARAATRVAVTELEYDKAAPLFQPAAGEGFVCFRAPAEEAALAAAIRSAGARHVVVGVETFRGPLYAALPAGGELKGRNLAVIGCGPIGQRVAGIAARGFGMNVVGFKRSMADAEGLQRDAGFAGVTTDFGAAVRAAD